VTDTEAVRGSVVVAMWFLHFFWRVEV